MANKRNIGDEIIRSLQEFDGAQARRDLDLLKQNPELGTVELVQVNGRTLRRRKYKNITSFEPVE